MTGNPHTETSTAIRNALMERVLVLDGAMGTQIQDYVTDGSNEGLNLSRPDVILSVHRSYICRLQQSELRIRELEQENERLLLEQQKNDLWSSRVTYENVVELIASYEDA